MNLPRQKGEGTLVSIVILNWNGVRDTLRCLESVLAQKYPDYKVIVVDNGSAEDDVALLRQRYGGDIQLIAHERNLGYAGGCNSAIQRVLAEGRSAFIWLLNNDALVPPECLGQLVRAMEDEKVAIAGPTIYYDGADAHKVWYAGGRVDWWRGRPHHHERVPEPPTSRAVEFVSGCAMLVRTSLFRELGLLDDRFFAYFEDADLCVRAQQAGLRCMYVPVATAAHKVSASSRAQSDLYTYLLARNRILFMRLHGRWWHRLVFFPYQFAKGALSLPYGALALRRPSFGAAFLRGMQDGLSPQPSLAHLPERP